MTSIALETLADRVRRLPAGKRIRDAVYVHRDVIEQYDADVLDEVRSLADAAGGAFLWNVCKIRPHPQLVSLLHYPRFREDEHPALSAAASVDLNTGVVRIRRYAANGNRPILHRKELLLDTVDPDFERFAALTDEEERAGLYSTPKTIGYERGWSEALDRRGLVIRCHRLMRKGL